MAIIDLNNCFPLSERTGTRSPLPKQSEFLQSVLDPKGPKYVLYAGGVGSGKSMIGCITMLTLAVLYPGDYLVCRQFNPELKLTTYKTFLDICPKELIVEHRVADQIIKIKSQNGKVSNVIFRGLEDPDKHRSLNLNAAYIDESSQVSEEAFFLLQSRLRGAHVRKIFMTTNPAGHDWQYNLFVKQDGIQESSRNQFSLIVAPSTENIHLPDGYVESMMATYSKERIEREVMASFDSFAGQIYHEFRRDVHVVQPFEIPAEWPRYVGVDHGFNNHAAWVWGAVDYDGNIYIYREFYEREWLIKEICRGKGRLPGVIHLNGKDRLSGIFIDPSTKRTSSQTGSTDFATYCEYIPKNWPLMPASNEVNPGIDRVKTFLQINKRTNKPKLTIFNTCRNLIEEIVQYRWDELPEGQKGLKNDREQPRKYKDHACDALRYLIMSRPQEPKQADVRKLAIENNHNVEGTLQREWHLLHHPIPKDPFE